MEICCDLQARAAGQPAFSSSRPDEGCRFLYVVGQLGAGGLERQLCYLLSALDRERYRPAVVVWNGSSEDFHSSWLGDLDVPLVFLPAGAGPAAKLGALFKLGKKLKPEVVHSYSFYTNFAAHLTALGIRAVALGSVRGEFDWTKKACGLIRGSLSARWPRAQIFNSFSALESARRCRSPLAPRQLFAIPNALDLREYRAMPFSNSNRTEILGIGSLLPVKRWDRALEAARELKSRGRRFRIRIAGGGPLRAALEARARGLEVSDCVEFLGHRADVTRLLGASRFLVHTSDNEGCPNAVMEAMACGRAVVATDAGDVPVIVQEGKTGFVVRRGEEGTLVERMGYLLDNPDACRRMGEAGRARADERFFLDRLVDETLAAYREAGWKETGPAHPEMRVSRAGAFPAEEGVSPIRQEIS